MTIPNLDPRHLEELAASAIPPELVLEAGIRSMTHPAAYDFGFRHPNGNDGQLVGWLIPYLDPATGEPSQHFARLKLDTSTNGTKYLQPVAERPRLYFTPGTTTADLRDTTIPIYIVEGEKKALALLAWARRRGVRCVVIAIGGCASWQEPVKGELPDGSIGKLESKPISDLDLIAWQQREVILGFDSDVQTKQGVAAGEAALARELIRRGAVPKAIRIPPGKDGQKQGVDDVLHDAGDAAWLNILKNLIPHHGRLIRTRDIRIAAGEDPRPEIRITTEQTAVVDAAEQALIEADVNIYSRGRVLVEVSRQTKRLPWLTRPAGSPAISAIADPRLRELMGATARFMAARRKPGKKAKCSTDATVEYEPALPPTWAVSILMTRPSWRFPEITMVTETPLLAPDGRIIDRPGYDDDTGVLFLPGDATYPPIPESPTIEGAKKAIEALKDPIRDFPFVADSDWSAALAAMMTPLARPAFPGPAPCFKIGANVQGTGKSLLSDVISMIITGRAAPKMPKPTDEAEASKRILAIAIEALPLVVMDNVTGLVDSAALAAALTATEWKDRLLGRNETVTAPLTTMWIMTANNPVFSSDLARRIIPIDMDPHLEDPESRTGFKYPDLRAHIETDRPKLVTAILTILRAFHVAGRPQPKNKEGKPLPQMGSYEGWDALIRAALIWAGEVDPIEGRATLQKQSDVEREALSAALAAWTSAFQTDAMTAAKAIQRAGEDGDLHAALAGLAGCAPKNLDTRKIGLALRKVKRRIVNDKLFDCEEGNTGGASRWLVKTVEGKK